MFWLAVNWYVTIWCGGSRATGSGGSHYCKRKPTNSLIETVLCSGRHTSLTHCPRTGDPALQYGDWVVWCTGDRMMEQPSRGRTAGQILHYTCHQPTSTVQCRHQRGSVLAAGVRSVQSGCYNYQVVAAPVICKIYLFTTAATARQPPPIVLQS